MPSKLRPPVVSLLVSLLLLSGSFTSSARERGLSFEERVRAQEAIERAYYSHQLEATEPFEKAVPRSVLEAKVTRYLRQSIALEEVWKTPVTGAMLDAELRRIASQTREPERLREMYDALRNDSFLIQECFARSSLVERLTRSFFQGDRALHAARREEAEGLARHLRQGSGLEAADRNVPKTTVELRLGSGSPEDGAGRKDRLGLERRHAADAVGRDVSQEEMDAWRLRLPSRVGEVSEVEESPEAFIVRVLKASSLTSLRFQQYTVAKESHEAWWKKSRDRFDANRAMTVAEPAALPEPGRHSASSGSGPQIESGTCSAGGDSWDSAGLGRIPLRRSGHTAVWTGNLMLVWGGDEGSNPSGERYDPLTDTWTPMSTIGMPENRSGHTAVWTGTEMIVWGGKHYPPNNAVPLSTGGRYNPVTDSWTATSIGPGRTAHTAVWTGTEMIIFGGQWSLGGLNTGSRYDPATDSWTPIRTPGWTAKVFHSAVWTGTKMLIWGGSEGGSFGVQSGGAYDPATDFWTAITTSGAPPASERHTAIWTGSRMVVWGGEANDFANQLATGGIYDPDTNSWARTSEANVPVPRAAHTALWTGSEMIVWGGRKGSNLGYNSGARFNPVSNTWTPINAASAPAPSYQHTAVWTGSRMLVWGTATSQSYSYRTGGRYDPATDSWTPISLAGGGAFRTEHTAVWTGTRMIVWGGRDEASQLVQTGDRYDPLLDQWAPVSLTGAPAARTSHTAVWTGSQMIIWGGANVSELGTGGRYNPTTDTWTSTATTGAPSARYGHTAVWTGTLVLIWGGRTGAGDIFTPGGRYNPSTNTWQAISLQSPQPRSRHAAVWTGNRMIVWGGITSSFNPLNDGGLYRPNNDQWESMTITNAPSARYLNAAVWTGSTMLIWGGTTGSAVGDGSSYEPGADTWTAISNTGAPAARIPAIAVWSGTEMIVWGGGSTFSGTTTFATGGRYDPANDLWTDTTLEGAPSSRNNHTAVWSGRHMIVWGGDHGGGRYAPAPTDTDGDGFTTCSGDCDDLRGFVHPGATETCDGIDEDCDGALDEGFTDDDGDGYAACGNDCNDADAGIHPGAGEACNGLDDNCDSVVDNADFDQDGFSACTNDCNDLNAGMHPGATEACNGLDEDCDAVIDEGFTDADADGYASCIDCNDSNAGNNPGAAEVCNHLDENCNLLVDEDFPNQDDDGYAVCAGDCDDLNPNVWFAPSEVSGVTLSQSGTQTTFLSWNTQFTSAGWETIYDLVSGQFGPVTGMNLGVGSCLYAGLSSSSFITDLRSDPPAAAAYWYLARARNSCGTGTYGMNTLGQERNPPACP